MISDSRPLSKRLTTSLGAAHLLGLVTHRSRYNVAISRMVSAGALVPVNAATRVSEHDAFLFDVRAVAGHVAPLIWCPPTPAQSTAAVEQANAGALAACPVPDHPTRQSASTGNPVRPAPPGAVNSIERQMSVPRHTAMTPEQITRATSLLEDGCSYREAARTIGVSRDVVMRALPGYGWSYADAGRFAASVRWAAR